MMSIVVRQFGPSHRAAMSSHATLSSARDRPTWVPFASVCCAGSSSHKIIQNQFFESYSTASINMIFLINMLSKDKKGIWKAYSQKQKSMLNTRWHSDNILHYCVHNSGGRFLDLCFLRNNQTNVAHVVFAKPFPRSSSTFWGLGEIRWGLLALHQWLCELTALNNLPFTRSWND